MMGRYNCPLIYNPETGQFTRLNTIRKVGTIGNNGYLQIRWNGKIWLAHRIAFVMMGEPLPQQVDHINGNRLDNRWCNLRSGDKSVNANNRDITQRLNNIYRYNKTRWRIKYTEYGKQKHHGVYDNFCEAVRAEQVRKHHLFKLYHRRN